MFGGVWDPRSISEVECDVCRPKHQPRSWWVQGGSASSECTQSDMVWHSSASCVPDVCLSLSPDCHCCVSVALPSGLNGSDRPGVVSSLAWHQSSFLTELIPEHEGWQTPNGFAFLLFLTGVARSEETWQLYRAVITSGTCHRVTLDHLLLALIPFLCPCLSFSAPKKLCVCKYRNSDLFKVLL